SPEVGMAPRVLGPALPHADPAGEPQAPDRVAEEVGSAVVAVEQHPGRRREGVGQDQSRHAAAGAQVKGVSGCVQCTGCGRPEPEGMRDVGLDRTGPEEPEALGLLEDGGDRPQDEVASGVITTRRRGSSPSEVVLTPSMVFTVSWTTLRSAGDIGSRTNRVPVERTRSTCWRVKASRATRRFWR